MVFVRGKPTRGDYQTEANSMNPIDRQFRVREGLYIEVQRRGRVLAATAWQISRRWYQDEKEIRREMKGE